jgi:hypothetical protein
MDEWLKQLEDSVNSAAKDSSQWLTEVSQQAERAIEQWLDSSLEGLEGVDQAISPALEQFSEQLDNALDAGLVFIDQQIAPWIESVSAPLTHTVTPWLQNHPTCVGCRNYHGGEYGDEMLVCAMHPYGPEDSTCEDWESVWPNDSAH